MVEEGWLRKGERRLEKGGWEGVGWGLMGLDGIG